MRHVEFSEYKILKYLIYACVIFCPFKFFGLITILPNYHKMLIFFQADEKVALSFQVLAFLVSRIPV